MIGKVLSQVSEEIMETPWLERYGGLAKLVSRKKDGKKQVFPVSCDLTGSDCFESGRYKDLVPNSKKASIAYWLIDRPTQINSNVRLAHSYDANEFRTRLKLVVWVNMQKLGQDDCYTAELFAAETLKRIQSTLQNKKITVPFKTFKHSLSPAGISYEPKDIFKGLDYEDVEALSMYPYTAFAIYFDFAYTTSISCLPDVNIDDPYECLPPDVTPGGDGRVDVFINTDLMDQFISQALLRVINSEDDNVGEKQTNDKWLIQDINFELEIDDDVVFLDSVPYGATGEIEIEL